LADDRTGVAPDARSGDRRPVRYAGLGGVENPIWPQTGHRPAPSGVSSGDESPWRWSVIRS